MKTPVTLAVLFLLLLLFALGFQHPARFDGVGASAKRYAPDFPKVVRRVEATYRADSLQAEAYAVEAWRTYWSRRWDAFLEANTEMCSLAEKLLEQRFDPRIFEVWASGYGGIGMAKIYLGEPEEGTRIINEALAIAIRVRGEDKNETAMAYYGLGHMAAYLFDDPDMALDYYRKGEAIARRALPPGDPRIANGVRNLGFGYWLKGDYTTAMRYYNSILNDTTLGDYRKPHIYGRLTGNFFTIGDYETALSYALLTAQYPDAPTNLLLGMVTIANCYLLTGNLDSCAARLESCERYYRKHKAEIIQFNYEVEFNQVKADYYLALKNYPKALEFLKTAIAATDVTGVGQNTLETIDLYQKLAETYMAMDSLSEARETIGELLFREAGQFRGADFFQNPEVARFTRQPDHLRTLELKGRVFEQQYAQSGNTKDLHHALSVYLLADSLVDHIRDTYRGTGAKNQLAGAARPVYQRGLGVAFELWKKTGSQRHLDKAWYFAEKSKSIELLESLRDLDAKRLANIRPEDEEHEKKLKRDIGYYEKMALDERAKDSSDLARISKWNYHVFTLKHSLDSLLTIFKKRYPDYYRLKYSRNVATIADAQAKLPDGTALVEYVMGDSALFTFLMDRSRCTVFRYDLDSAFHRDMKSLRAGIHDFDPAARRTGKQATDDFRAFTGASHRLFRALLAEPLRHTKASRLIVAPDDVIGYVPFAALLTQPVAENAPVDYRGLPYLVRDHAVRLEYSGTLFANQKSASGRGDYFGMAPAYPGGPIASRALPDSMRFSRAFRVIRGGDVPALRYNGEEVERASGISGGQTRIGIGATEDVFKQHAAKAGVLHLAMHALTNDEDPMYSTLVFAGGQSDSTGENDGFLHAYELYNMRLHAELAVLSACNTGAGKVVRGEGIMSLARAFRYAGCSNVMMSLWPVNDLSGKNLVADFFQKLSSGKGKASALQAAQVDFLNKTHSDEQMHPYYWATFILVGDDEPLGSGTVPAWVWVGLLAAAGAAGAWFWMRRRAG